MKKFIYSFIFALLAASLFAQNTNWKLDKAHSSIGFSVDHLIISETVGKFNDYTLDVKSDKADFSDAKFNITIKTKSIDTDHDDRDKHLKSEDFFNIKKYPEIIFKGEEFKKISDIKYIVIGELTMQGVTKKIEFEAKFGGIIKDPWGGRRAGLKLWGEIDRYEFGLKYNSTLEAGGLTIGQMVRVECRLELVKG